MRATFTDEQVQLQQVVSDLASSSRPEAPRAHEAIPESTGATEALMGGFAGLGVPEDRGGAGGGLVELAIVCHELGRHLVSTPFVPHVLATHVALATDLDVSAAASGSESWTLAADESDSEPLGPWGAGGDTVKPRVPYGATADRVVATVGGDGVALATAAATDEGDGTLDLGRPAASVTLTDVGPATDRGAAAGMLRAMALLGAELVGVGRGAVELGTDYAKQREQFGQPIGRFQAVAHQLADSLVVVEEAWSLVLYAAWAVDAGAEDAARAVHVAKAAAADAAVFATERCTQVHGGIGITWEALPHLYLRRAMSDATWLGDAAWHRQQVGRGLLAATR